jgi:4-amino-4-deoxy-L-arabinose transferase-like glycosyltransferase
MGGLKQLENKKYSPNLESDEPAWIFTGYYFNLYFLRFDLFHPDWNDYEAFDQPPLAKYIVGGTLFLKGYTIDSLDPKKFWNSIPADKLPLYFDLVKHKIPNPTVVIPFTRSVIFLFALSSLLLIYFFVRSFYGVLPAVISTSLVISNPIYNYYSIRIIADPILLFFFSLFILLCALYLKSGKNVYIVFTFIVSSLAFLTKLNGILLVFVVMAILLIREKFSISKKDWKFLIIGFVAFLLTSILLNPVFLNIGIKTIWKMIEVRLSATHVLQETFKDAALLSVSERFVYATKTIFFRSCLFYPLIKVPVELIMFGLGIYYIFKKKDFFLISVFVFLVVIPISLLPYNVPRYFYWIYPFIYIIAGLSLNLFKEILGKKDVRFLKS